MAREKLQKSSAVNLIKDVSVLTSSQSREGRDRRDSKTNAETSRREVRKFPKKYVEFERGSKRRELVIGGK